MKRSASRQPARSPRTTTSPPPGTGAARGGLRRMCAVREGPPRQFPSTLSGERTRLIIMHADKWVNGTVVKYAFFEPKEPFSRWAGTDALRGQVRKAFQRYMDLGIGVRFELVADRASAQVRIGFEEGDGHWSYVGRQVLRQGVGRPHDEPRPDGPHLQRGLRRRRRDPRDRPHARISPRAPEPERRHRLGRGGGIPGAGRAAQQLVARDDLPQHHPEDPAGPGPGLLVGPRLGHALPVRAGPDPEARAVPAGPAAGGRPLPARPGVGAHLLSSADGRRRQGAEPARGRAARRSPRDSSAPSC